MGSRKTLSIVALVVTLGVPFVLAHPAFAADANVAQVQDFIRNVIKVIAGLAGLVATGFFVAGGFTYITSSGNPEQPISIDTSSVVLAEARLASAKNALDGSGDFTEALCEELKEIALRYDSSSDFVSCAYPGRLYLDTPDTSNSEILTISDDTYTSKFVVDIDSSQLKGYEFTQSTSPGFNSYGGRN